VDTRSIEGTVGGGIGQTVAPKAVPLPVPVIAIRPPWGSCRIGGESQSIFGPYVTTRSFS